MARKLKEIKQEILSLKESDKEVLLRALISDIDSASEASIEIEKKWLIEAQKRFREIKEGAVETIAAEDSIRGARS